MFLVLFIGNELNVMLCGLKGGIVFLVFGGDLVFNLNVLLMGWNMYSINVEIILGILLWEEGKWLVEVILKVYCENYNGEYLWKVSYFFWVGEFIMIEGVMLV